MGDFHLTTNEEIDLSMLYYRYKQKGDSMKTLRALTTILAAAGLLAFAAPAEAHWHGHPWHGWHGHNGPVFVGFGFPYYWGPYWGYSYWGYPYYPYYGYAPPYSGYNQQGVYEGRVVNPPNQTNDSGKDYSMATQIQRHLAATGYYHGQIDGVIGEGTRQAIRNYQRANSLPVTGRINGELINAMGLG